MLKKSSNSDSSSHNHHTNNTNTNNNNNPHDDRKKKHKIQWDEITIAEHDKERGSRQKIDEAPTPYRYLSESDQSEAEYSSDGEHLARCKAGNTVADSWESLHAKLQYEKHLQDLQQGDSSTSRMEQLETAYDYSSSHDTNTGDEMSVGANDPPTSEFGEVLSHEKKVPIRPAIKNIGNGNGSNVSGPITSPKPPKRTATEKPRKSVFIKANDTIASTANSNTSTPTFSNMNNYWGTNSSNLSMSSSPNTVPNGNSSTNNSNLFAGINGSIGGDEPETHEQKEQFKRKRAGHYNEYKVLQAMRSKMTDDEDDEDEDSKAAYPPMVRHRALEKVNSLQLTNSNTATVSHSPPPAPLPSLVSDKKAIDPFPMEEA